MLRADLILSLVYSHTVKNVCYNKETKNMPMTDLKEKKLQTVKGSPPPPSLEKPILLIISQLASI